MRCAACWESCVEKSERSIEGIYWLAVLRGKPFEATAATLNGTDHIEQGYLVVKAQWLKLEQRDNGYSVT